MKIELRRVPIRDLTEGYTDDGESGVRGYGGKLDIRPPYQREFIYKDRQRNAVIDTIRHDFPLNVMYWAVRDDGTFEIIDGQQRTISIAQYVTGIFSFDGMFFENLPKDKQAQILDYELMVYLCSGTDSERLDWFRTINIAGEKLNDQELRNAVYAGPWLTDARRYFSRSGCPAHGKGNAYLSGSSIRQDYLETAIKWISDGKIEDYMGRRQNEPTAVALWTHFQSVIDWVEAIFPVKRPAMKGVDWGGLYNRHRDATLDPAALEADVKRLMQDDDVKSKAGVYAYLLDGDESHLNLRAFPAGMKAEAFERQGGVCPLCGETFSIGDMEGDHIDPWSQGGRTVAENCQMLCRPCNRRKGDK